MKKLFLLTCTLFTLFSCTTDNSNLETENETFSISAKEGDSFVTNVRNCASQGILEEELKKDPELAIKIEEIEDFTRRAFLNLDLKKLIN